MSLPLEISDLDQALQVTASAINQAEQKRVSRKIFPQLAASISPNTAVIHDELSLNAWLVLNSPYRYHWLCAGVGVGKSYLLARYMVRRILENWETVGLVAANTHTQLAQSTLPHLFELLDEAGLDYVSGKPPKAWKASSKFKGGYKDVISVKVGVGKVAYLLKRSLTGWKRIRGVNIGWAVIDEISDTVVGAWNEIIKRLRDHKHSHKLQIIVAGIPDLPGDNWTWEVFNPKDPEAKKLFRVTFQSSTEARHLSWDEYILPMLRTLPPLEALQQVFARIVINQTGRAYYAYRDGINNVKKYDYDPERPLFLNLDFNILSSAPISAAIFQEFDNGNGDIDVQVIDEIVIPGATTLDACSEFLARYGDHKGEVWVFGDATGNLNRTTPEFQHVVNKLFPHFKHRLIIISETKSNPKVSERVAAVNAKLRSSLGIATLFIDPDKCPELILDFRKLMPKDGDIDKSDKARSHVSDALGYGLFIRFPPFSTKPIRRAIKANY